MFGNDFGFTLSLQNPEGFRAKALRVKP